MRFFKSAVSVALAAFAAVTLGQPSNRPNAITAPTAGTVIEAGEPFEITWMNIVGEQVTLVVMDGASGSLQPVRTIVTNVPNTGSYTWNVPEDLPASGSYTIRISYDRNPSNFNYSDRFVFQSEFVSTSSVASTTSAPTTSTSSVASTTSESSSSSETEATTSGTSTTVRTTSTRRTTTSESTSQPTEGAPPSAGTTTLSSPLAVIMAVLAATLFIH